LHWDIVSNFNLDEMIKLDERISPKGVKNSTNGVSYNDSEGSHGMVTSILYDADQIITEVTQRQELDAR
jgi:hypothetical protein